MNKSLFFCIFIQEHFPVPLLCYDLFPLSRNWRAICTNIWKHSRGPSTPHYY